MKIMDGKKKYKAAVVLNDRPVYVLAPNVQQAKELLFAALLENNRLPLPEMFNFELVEFSEPKDPQ